MKDKQKFDVQRQELLHFAHFMPKNTKPLVKSKPDTAPKKEKKSTKK